MKYFIILALFSSLVFTQTEVSGSVSGNWTAPNSPYIVTNNLVLQPSDTLSISEGVEIRFDGEFRFDIFGTFLAIGTETDSVKFTSNSGGTWMSLNFADYANDNSIMQYCIVEYASDSGYEPYLGAINSNNSSPTILNCRISHCSSSGLYLDYSDNSQIVYNFISSVDHAIFISNTNSANISYNVINSSSNNGIYIDTGCNLVDFHFNSISNCGDNGIRIDNGNDSLLISSNSIFDNGHDGILFISNNNDIALVDNVLSNNTYGIRFASGSNSNMLIHNNVITSNSNDGVNFWGSNNQNFSVHDNLIFNNTGYGVYSSNSNGNFGTIFKNVISSNSSGGIMILRFSSGPGIILNNTIFNNGDTGITLQTLSDNTEVINNNVSDNTVGIYSLSSYLLTINNNNIWNNISGNYSGNFPDGTGNLININLNGNVCDIYFNISESPQYVDPFNQNFNLQPTSPNIDAGDPTYIDIDGTVSDIGALPLLQEVPAMVLSHSEINFGQINLGEIDTISIIITSTGTVDLEVSGIQIEGGGFFVTDDNFTLSNGEQYSFDVIFAPTENISYSGVLTISNNSSANPEFELVVSGTAFEIYYGPTYYVGINGSDTNNGSIEMPYATIQAAVNVASDGDTVRISPGYYQESNIDIEHAIHIFGSGIDSTVVDANWEGYFINYNCWSILDTLLLTDIIFENGSSESQSGGINFTSNSGGLIISNCTFNNNHVSGNGDKAGAIYSNGYIECTNSTFTSNTGNGGQWSGSAAAILMRRRGVINNCIFTDNSSNVAVRIINFGDITLANSTFSNNSSGAIVMENVQNVRISNINAWQNTAQNGAFLKIQQCENVVIDSVIVNNNYASQKGGALWVSGSNLEINKSDIIYNSAYDDGGGIYIYNQTELPQIRNTILWGNTAGGISNQIINANGVLDVSYCDIQGGYDGNNNIDSHPMFIDILNMNFNLQIDSPCINAGNPSSQLDPDSSITDIGRYHFPTEDFVDEFRITSIVDVPEDNGGQVIISWQRSIYDGLLALYHVTHYAIWRWNETPDGGLPEYFENLRDGWEYIGDSPAQEFQEYSYIAPTLLDSTDSGLPMTSFLIVALTSDPDIFFVSDPDSGYSVDNLAPSIPSDLTVSEFGAIYTIEWMSSNDIDISFYSIFRDGILLEDTSNNFYTDSDTEYGGIYSYQLSAHDIHNNQSQLSEPLIAVSGFLGDANGDQNIDVLDIVLMVGIILESEAPGLFESWVSDLNHDSTIDVLDIVQLVAIILDSVEVNNSNTHNMKVQQ